MATPERILITGGAGFVGSHLADALAAAGHMVTLFDNLEPQVHGACPSGRPAYLNPAHRLVRGDVQDYEALAPLVRQADVVVHLAAMVGVGQSMYQVRRYTDANALGTATLLQVLVDDPGRVRKVLVASSMSVYGEGAYECAACGAVTPRQRSAAQLDDHQWEPRCPRCGGAVRAIPTAEDTPLSPSSIYAVNKRDQEELIMAFGRAYRLPTTALRFWNIYGSRQALSNPYTGLLAIFSSRMLSGQPPLIFEDGQQRRDFVHVSDIVQACMLAVARPEADYEVFNVGSGQAVTVSDVAALMAQVFERPNRAETTGRYRVGDIRHGFPDINKARARLDYAPRVRLEDGLIELVRWVKEQQGVQDSVDAALRELTAHGLAR